jgi:hypothetical protein
MVASVRLGKTRLQWMAMTPGYEGCSMTGGAILPDNDSSNVDKMVTDSGHFA